MVTPTGLPQWIHAPVGDWVFCGELADATYIYNEDLRKKTVEANLKDLRDKLHAIDPDFKLHVPVWTTAEQGPTAFAGFVASRGRDVYVVWRGTVLNEEWLADGQVHQEEWEGAPGFVHSGFKKLYHSAMQDQPYKQVLEDRNISRVFLTGHSLGGALATLTAYHIAKTHTDLLGKLRLVTFSAPRSMSHALARDLQKKVPDHVRLITDGDLVPVVPLYTGIQPRAEEKRDIFTLAKFLHTVVTIIQDLLGRPSDQLVAHYHHAGIGISLSGAGVERFKWTVGNHHSLKLILHLLDPKHQIDKADLEGTSEAAAALVQGGGSGAEVSSS